MPLQLLGKLREEGLALFAFTARIRDTVEQIAVFIMVLFQSFKDLRRLRCHGFSL